jgi:hypothetical protein
VQTRWVAGAQELRLKVGTSEKAQLILKKPRDVDPTSESLAHRSRFCCSIRAVTSSLTMVEWAGI